MIRKAQSDLRYLTYAVPRKKRRSGENNSLKRKAVLQKCRAAFLLCFAVLFHIVKRAGKNGKPRCLNFWTERMKKQHG